MPQPDTQKPQSIVALAQRLCVLGYYPVPIPAGCKGPVMKGWGELRLTPEQCPDYFEDGVGMLVGVLHANVLALDIDVYDPKLAARIVAEGKRRFPNAIERIGEAPKSALFFHLPNPFKITATRRHSLGTVTGQVDVRSVTRQIVAYGRHPVTNRPYRWPDAELFDTPAARLESADEPSISSFRDWCEAQLSEWAGTPAANVVDLDHYARQSRSMEGRDEDQFLAALKFIPADVGYDEWVRTLMAIHDFYSGGASGLSVAIEWSRPYDGFTEREVAIKWRSFEVGRGVGYRSAFAAARAHGADLSELARSGIPERAQPPSIPLSDDFTPEHAAALERQDRAHKADPVARPHFDTTPVSIDDLTNIGPRRWLYGRKLLRGFCSVIISPGGGAKSTWTTAVACDMAANRQTLHDAPHGACKSWIYNLEDPREEGLRKIAAVKRISGLPDDAMPNVILSSGRDRPLIVAQEIERGVFAASPDVDLLVEAMIASGVDLLIVDPAIRAHNLPENDNKAIDLMMDQFARVAHEADASVLLVHHTRKGAIGGDMDAARGASSMASAARVVLTLSPMSPEEAADMNVPETERRRHIRVDDAKQNLSPPAIGAEWFKLESAELGNGNDEYPEGDFVGVAVAWTPPSPWEDVGPFTHEIMERINRGFVHEDGSVEPYSASRNTGDRHVSNAVLASFKDGDKSPKQAMQIVGYWKEKGLLEERDYTNNKGNSRKGVFISSPKDV